MNQSPGRGSPSSTASSNTESAAGSFGCDKNGMRHSVSSFDSGRASSTIYQQGVQLSGLSSESSSGNLRHSYHSSNSSLGSLAAEEICSFDVPTMVAHGIPDHDILNAWLTGMRFECYYKNFVQAGYDMPTISRMTPEDLNAIGITKPHHRKRLKMEISQLKISNGLPNYIPETLNDWLRLLNLEEYAVKLGEQGYQTVPQITNITWEDLEEIGITKLGHQKKFMLAIKRILDLMSGKQVMAGNTCNTYATPTNAYAGPSVMVLPDSVIPKSSETIVLHQQRRSCVSRNKESVNCSQQQQSVCLHSEFGSTTRGIVDGQQPSSHYNSNCQDHAAIHLDPHSDVVSIQLKNKNWSNHRTPSEKKQRISSFLPVYNQPSAISNTKADDLNRYSNLSCLESDSGVEDYTKTLGFLRSNKGTASSNESSQSMKCSSFTATLPRQSKKNSMAHAYESGLVTSADWPAASSSTPLKPFLQTLPQVHSADGYKSLPRDIGKKSDSSSRGNFSVSECRMTELAPQVMLQKNVPPPPPKRSHCFDKDAETCVGERQKNKYSGQAVCNNPNFSSNPPMQQLRSQEHIQASACSKPNVLLNNFPSEPHQDDTCFYQSEQVAGTLTDESLSSSVRSNFYAAYPQYILKIPPYSSLKERDHAAHANDTLETDPRTAGIFYTGVRRNGSDASFKSNSSTESESLPFANDNAGTIKQQKCGLRSHSLDSAPTARQEPAMGEVSDDVFGDIGNMLADLTDELDAILEQELISKR